MRKRALALLMTLCMVLSLVTPALATEGDVAQIGEQTYATLNEAIDAAADGATIQLLGDATLLTTAFPSGKTITIVGTNASGENYTIDAKSAYLNIGGNVTFKDCTLNMYDTPNGHWMYFYMASNGSLTFDQATVNIDGSASTDDLTTAMYFPEPNTSPADVTMIDSEVTIKNCHGNGISWGGQTQGGNNSIEITSSKLIIDNCAQKNTKGGGGIIGTFDITISQSKVYVKNNKSYGSNGSNFYISNGSEVQFEKNGTHGISAKDLTIEDSTVNSYDNGYYGIYANGKFLVDSSSKVNVKGNSSKYDCAGLKLTSGVTNGKVEAGAEINILNNYCSGLSNNGKVVFEEGSKLTITGNNNDKGTTSNGGGIYNSGDSANLTLPSDAIIYNNHAKTAGDDIFNNTTSTITFGPVGSDWALDGDQDKLDCNGASHAIDGWYYDSAGSRWNAHSVPTHVEEFIVGSAAVHDLLALKAAHDVIPLEPGDPDLPDVDHSKSKTATNLEKQEDGTYTSEVTLSLPSAQEELVTDVVFVLDKSTSTDVKSDALQMLSALKDQITDTGAKVKVGVVIFNKVANVTDFMDLSTEYDKIETAIKQDISSGTNTHAGPLAGKAMLDGDDSVSADRKYLIFVSDGITYMYNAEPTATAWSFNQPNSKDDWHGPGSFGTFAGPDNWYSKYHTNNGPSSWSEWLSTVAAQVATQGTTYEYPYGGTIITATPEDKENWDENYAMSIDKALYLTYQTYQEAVSAGYHCYSVVANTGSGGEYTWGPSFMTYLAGGNTVSFDDIQKDIYYLLAAGTKVEDYMGYVADDYNFDFVADGLTMKVGEAEYSAEKISDNKYGFVLNTESKDGYDYTLTYDYGNGKGTEHFVWEINVPVSNFAPVQLTYTVKLVNPKTTEGTYGVYDKNGDGLNDETGEKLTGNTGLYTNNSATLNPVDSNNMAGIPENFPKPTVSYTVAQETGTLTVQKIVADHVEDWSFDFTATIGDKTEKFTLTKNDPTKTFDSIPLDTQYTVKEDNSGKYQVTSTNETGTITENSSAVFVNMPVDTGVLTISKTVEGQKNPTEKFTFTVNLPEGEYPYIYSTAQGNDEVSGHISNNETVTLSSGQSVSIYGLPVGASYTVTETANDDYTVSAEAIHGTVDGAVVSGTIPDLDDGAAAAHYTNTYHGSWIPPVKPVTPIRPPVDPDKPELNTEDHYAYIVGYPDGNVKPEGNITRAEVATIFFRLLTDESRDEFWSQTNDYTDVPADAWYNNAVSTLTNAGIIDGYEDGTFKPDGNITRAEFATIAVRFFEATYDGEDLFSDIAGHWAQDYINEAANAGIVDGYPDGTFRPQQLITRAEAMTMVNRTIDRHPHKDHLLDDMIVWPDNPETAWYYEQVQEATNSHEYTMNTDDEQNPYEIWTELLPNRDWSELEKAWSDANDGAGSGEVV